MCEYSKYIETQVNFSYKLRLPDTLNVDHHYKDLYLCLSHFEVVCLEYVKFGKALYIPLIHIPLVPVGGSVVMEETCSNSKSGTAQATMFTYTCFQFNNNRNKI